MARMKELASETYAISIVEEYIRKSNEWNKQLNTQAKYEDFNKEDIVKCTFLKGLFRIVGPSLLEDDGRITIQNVDHESRYFVVSPDFLKKVKVSDKMLRVLYGD